MLDKAASTESGTAGALLAGGLGVGIGLSAGLPLGQQLSQALSNQPNQSPASSGAPADPVAKLLVLKKLLDEDLILQTEYDAKKKQILDLL